jgi:lactoylglutathione lyase
MLAPAFAPAAPAQGVIGRFLRAPRMAMKGPVRVPLTSPAAAAAPASLVGANPVFAQCMLRISDPEKSREFYEGKLGMKYLTTLEFEDMRFSLLFFAFTDDVVPDPSATTRAQRASWLWSRPYPTLELTWNWPASPHAAREVLANGNVKPDRGFGHTGFLVDSASGAVRRLAESGVKVRRQPSAFADLGTIAFVEDPDSYWCEIIEKSGDVAGTSPVFAQAMLRVQRPEAAIAFFRQLGMTFVTQLDVPEAEFSLYFMAYTDERLPAEDAPRGEKAAWLWRLKECTVELTHNWLDDGQEPEEYTNGNDAGRRGFGHLGIIVDDVAAATKRLEDAGHTVVRPASPFEDVGTISFVSSPGESYWVELIQRTR